MEGERGRERVILEGVGAVIQKSEGGIEGESKQMSREKRLKKHSSQPSSSVLRRQKGAKWVIIVFYTDKDREGEGGRVGGCGV